MSTFSFAIENKIKANLVRFDLLALYRLLNHYGFGEDKIWFTSNHSLASQDRLIEAISFYGEEVQIVINFGILGAQTPLPSFWLKQIETDEVDGKQLSKVLGFLDHLVIQDFIGQIYPELNSQYFSNWATLVKQHMVLECMPTDTSLHWLFKLVFPEFNLTFSQNTAGVTLGSKSLIFGRANMGSLTTLGGKAKGANLNQLVELKLKTKDYRFYFNWEEEIKRRLQDYIFPLLDDKEIYLTINFQTDEPLQDIHLVNLSRLGIHSLSTGQQALRGVEVHSGFVRRVKPLKQNNSDWTDKCRIQV
ncbi:hypothetical protein [uncultured Shewanella sp.]|uniref:hypothetical protein n=1 Tax=uncultured Shewanella sp. TaxID=173975 RepID=UPI002630DF20|nr:hypothetical protein [uncultured Shewanella sp.]